MLVIYTNKRPHNNSGSKMTSNKTYDIVLTNGRVIDPETYLDGTYNVGINGGQIAAITDQHLI